jgi:hypothetical protein
MIAADFAYPGTQRSGAIAYRIVADRERDDPPFELRPARKERELATAISPSGITPLDLEQNAIARVGSISRLITTQRNCHIDDHAKAGVVQLGCPSFAGARDKPFGMLLCFLNHPHLEKSFTACKFITLKIVNTNDAFVSSA